MSGWKKLRPKDSELKASLAAEWDPISKNKKFCVRVHVCVCGICMYMLSMCTYVWRCVFQFTRAVLTSRSQRSTLSAGSHFPSYLIRDTFVLHHHYTPQGMLVNEMGFSCLHSHFTIETLCCTQIYMSFEDWSAGLYACLESTLILEPCPHHAHVYTNTHVCVWFLKDIFILILFVYLPVCVYLYHVHACFPWRL